MESDSVSAVGLRLRSRLYGGVKAEILGGEEEVEVVLFVVLRDGRRCCGWRWDAASSLKMWTVSEAEETQSKVDVALNAILQMREGMEPRLNC